MKREYPFLKRGPLEDIPGDLLRYIGEDLNREGLRNTPERYIKAWDHYSSGYEVDPLSVMKAFTDGAEGYDEMVIVKDIPVFSHCEHHIAPFFGHCHIAYIPEGKILGLSKFVRVVNIFMRRLQVQERLTNEIADAFVSSLKPAGVAIVMSCAHTCMIARGVSIAGSTTITSAMRGAFKNNSTTRAEFLSLIQ